MPISLCVPVLLRVRGYSFRFYASDHGEPPHVHVIGNGGVSKLWLVPRVLIAKARGYDRRQREEIIRVARAHREAWLAAWGAFFER